MFAILVLLKTADIDPDLGAKCFTQFSTLIGDKQFGTYTLVLQPNLQDTICQEVNGFPARVELFFSDRLYNDLCKQEGYINVDLRQAEVRFKLKCTGVPEYMQTINEIGASYIVHMNETVKSADAIQQIKHTQADSSACFDDIKMYFDSYYKDPKFKATFTKTNCNVPPAAEVFFEIENTTNNWISVQLPRGDANGFLNGNFNNDAEFMFLQFTQLMNDAQKANFNDFINIFEAKPQAQIRMKIVFKTFKVETDMISLISQKFDLNENYKSWKPINVYTTPDNVQVSLSTKDILDYQFPDKETARLCQMNLFYNSTQGQITMIATETYKSLTWRDGFQSYRNMTFDLLNDNVSNVEIQITIHDEQNRTLMHWVIYTTTKKSCIKKLIYSIRESDVCLKLFPLERQSCENVSYKATNIELQNDDLENTENRRIYAAYTVDINLNHKDQAYTEICLTQDHEDKDYSIFKSPKISDDKLSTRLLMFRDAMVKPGFVAFSKLFNAKEYITIITFESQNKTTCYIAFGLFGGLGLVAFLVVIGFVIRSQRQEQD